MGLPVEAKRKSRYRGPVGPEDRTGMSSWQIFPACLGNKIPIIVNLDSYIGNKFPIIVNLNSYLCFVKLKIF